MKPVLLTLVLATTIAKALPVCIAEVHRESALAPYSVFDAYETSSGTRSFGTDQEGFLFKKCMQRFGVELEDR